MTTIALWGIALLLVLMLLGMPIAISMLIASFVGAASVIGTGSASSLLANAIWHGFNDYHMMVIPMFVLMGSIAYRSGITRYLYDAAYTWFGHLPGGLASTTFVASAAFASICGSDTATTATMGSMALPEMKKYNYDPAFSGGAVAGGGTLGVIIPPSILLIIVSVQTGQSLLHLFLASIIPGLLLTFLFVSTVTVLCYFRPNLGPSGPRSSWKERFVSLAGVIEALLLFVLVIGGLYVGWFTPTESGAAGAAGTFVVGFLRGGLNWSRFQQALLDSLKVSAMVILLLTGAIVFGRFLALTRFPYWLAEWASGLPIPAWGVLSVIFVVYLIGGCISDALGFLIVTIPIFFPVAETLGYDVLWFSIIIGVITTLGAITPPVGINVYIVSGLDPDIDPMAVFRGVFPYFVTFFICIIVLFVFPEIVLFLPRVLLG